MYKLKKPLIHAIEIAGLINRDLVGENILVNQPASVDDIHPNSFVCLEQKDSALLSSLKGCSDVLLITDIPTINFEIPYIYTTTPSIDFLDIIKDFFLINDKVEIAASAKIHPNAKIGRNVSIGEHCVIGPDVEIGENSQVLHNVVIVNSVKIGFNCIIKHNSTIGSEGFDFQIDKLGVPVHYPHIGQINIGNNVWIGANTCIESGKIANTIIKDDVKIDDLVQIGYNCTIGEKTMITSGVVVERGVVIKEKTLVSPNATLNQYITVGADCIIGEGSVVIKSIEDNQVVVGNPAKVIRTK